MRQHVVRRHLYISKVGIVPPLPAADKRRHQVEERGVRLRVAVVTTRQFACEGDERVVFGFSLRRTKLECALGVNYRQLKQGGL